MPSAKAIPETKTAPPSDERERQRVEKPFSITRDERLKSLREKWMNGNGLDFFRKLPRQDLLEMGVPHEELRDAGLIGSLATNDEQIPYEWSLTQFAEWLTKNYGAQFNKTYHAKEISSWRELPGFPKMGKNKYYNSLICIQWFKENKAGEIGAGSNILAKAVEADANRKAYAAEREWIELQTAKRKFDATWMIAAAHDFQMDAQGHAFKQDRIAHDKQALERHRQVLVELGFDEAMIERGKGLMRDKLDADFESWQADDSEFGKKLDELDKQTWELSETKKLELK